jgi:hypothetical protein
MYSLTTLFLFNGLRVKRLVAFARPKIARVLDLTIHWLESASAALLHVKMGVFWGWSDWQPG